MIEILRELIYQSLSVSGSVVSVLWGHAGSRASTVVASVSDLQDVSLWIRVAGSKPSKRCCVEGF